MPTVFPLTSTDNDPKDQKDVQNLAHKKARAFGDANL